MATINKRKGIRGITFNVKIRKKGYRQNSNTGSVSQSHTYLVNDAAVSKESRTTSRKAWQ